MGTCPREPIGYSAGTAHLYEYVLARVLDVTDPFGLAPEDPQVTKRLPHDIDSWPDHGPPPGPTSPTTPSWVGWLTVDDDVYQQYAARHCWAQCTCSVFRAIGGVNIAGTQGDAIAIANNELFDMGEFDDGVLNPGDFEIVGGGKVKLKAFPGRLHSAFRHCLASGMIATRIRNCDCAACIADAREMYQYHWQVQGPTETVQGIFNNRQEDNALDARGHMQIVLTRTRNHSGSAGKFSLIRLDLGQSSEIKKCCRDKLIGGELGTQGTARVGGPSYPSLPPRQWPLQPYNVPPRFKWPGVF